MYVCMYVCVNIRIRIHVYICMNVYVCRYVYLYIKRHNYLHVIIHVHTHYSHAHMYSSTAYVQHVYSICTKHNMHKQNKLCSTHIGRHHTILARKRHIRTILQQQQHGAGVAIPSCEVQR